MGAFIDKHSYRVHETLTYSFGESFNQGKYHMKRDKHFAAKNDHKKLNESKIFVTIETAMQVTRVGALKRDMHLATYCRRIMVGFHLLIR